MVRIITDSAADFDPRELEQLNIACIPLKVMFADAEYEENISLSFDAVGANKAANGDSLAENEAVIDFTNSALTKFLIKLSATVEQSDEQVIGSYFHVLNDLERIGDHAENFYEIAQEMAAKKIAFSEKGQADI